jgi:excisionase family DNA binding protein
MREELITWKEVANHLGVNVRTAQRWERERGLPVRRLPGRGGRLMISRAALDAWQRTAKSQTRPSQEVTCYRWALSSLVTAELRLRGAPITLHLLNRLCQYLDLVQQSLQP